MKRFFYSDFRVKQITIPSGWLVEYNSDLRISALECGSDYFALLSPGNKYIAMTPDLCDAELLLTFGVNYSMSKRFDLLICFRYDLETRQGEALRLCKANEQAPMRVEYGSIADNRFSAEQTQNIMIDKALFLQPMPLRLQLQGCQLRLNFLDREWDFTTQTEARPGKFALSRGHFFDSLKISAFELRVPRLPTCLQNKEFTVTLPTEPTLYPIRVHVQLRDFGDCCEVELCFEGGVPETPIGEGTYHEMRADILTRPYFKVIDAVGQEKHTLLDDQLVLVVNELAPPEFYEVLHTRPEWPLRRTINFQKPSAKYSLAVGADEYKHNTVQTKAQTPSETVFSPEGIVEYSGQGISDKQAKIDFFSQPDKEIVTCLPKNDPRYQQALAFTRNNHYFLEGESIHFRVEITGSQEVPEAFTLTLENAFLETLRSVNFELQKETRPMGPLLLTVVVCRCDVFSDLAPGVYHLRCQSRDASVAAVEDYCAFEVMSRDPKALPPPLLSDLPFLYSSRTETRGLETDAFDPWRGTSVDEGHYIAAASFLPKCARDKQIAPTVHAYQREWFLWLGYRCATKPLLADNHDLIAQADYISAPNEIPIITLLWRHHYSGDFLKVVVEFLRQTGDTRFPIQEIEEAGRRGEVFDRQYFTLLAQDYWPQWLDFANQKLYEQRQRLLKQLRTLSPKILFANYGPAHIYVGAYKGQEFVRYLGNAHLRPDEQGFWQYEDYPMACRYGIERSTYFLTAALMALPEHRIYPEIYTYSVQGCPDGAVYYAHPPFGLRTSNDPLRIRRRIFDFAFASAHYCPGLGFEYWRRCGFQACGFDRERYEAMLKAWRVVKDFPPHRPLRSHAYVNSEAAWQANRSVTALTFWDHGSPDIDVAGNVVDVRKTAAEAVPFAYSMARCHGLQAGFQIDIEALSELTSQQCDLLVLPHLTGAAPACLDAIRRLHKEGVNLLAFEDVSGLEDLFGVEDTGRRSAVRHLQGTTAFMPGQKEFCDEPLCTGRYRAAGAEVLIEAEVPVLLRHRNGNATAAFFNVPPTLVRDDQLHQRMGYGKESISELINHATGLIMETLSNPEVSCSAGRLIAFEAQNQAILVIVTNPDEETEINPIVRFNKWNSKQHVVDCDRPYTVLSESETLLCLRIRLAPEDSAVIVLR